MADILWGKERYIPISPKNTFDFFSPSLGGDPFFLATEGPEVRQTQGQSWNNLLKTYYVPDTMLQTNTDEASVVSP